MGRLPDGRAVFVHRTSPGELVEATLVAERPRWARATLLRIIEPSADRRVPPCPHYAECGGCTLEHLHYPAQLAAKSRIAADALRRIGGIDAGHPEIVAAPHEHRYRNRVSFALRRLGNGRVLAGFHALHDPNRIVPIDGTCLLPEQAISIVWDSLRAAWGADASLLPSGERLRLTLRSTASGSVSLLVEGGQSGGRPEDLVERVEGLESVWHRRDGEEAIHAAGAQGLPERWGDANFTISGAAFLQVNREAAALLEEYVVGISRVAAGMHVVDAYCGIGLHARHLARIGARVTGIELDAEAIEIAEVSGGEGTTFLRGGVEELLEGVLPADLLILNPPRAGVDVAVIDQIHTNPPPRIIYISCDPATLARDLKRLGDRYRLKSVKCFDLFPQTAHVETVVALETAVLRRNAESDGLDYPVAADTGDATQRGDS